MTQTKAKDELETYLEHGGFGRVEREVPFVPSRKFRADYLLRDQQPPVIVEYDGLMHHGSNQGHATITQIMRDSEKANLATAHGYRYFRCNAKSIEDGSFFRLMDTVLTVIEAGGGVMKPNYIDVVARRIWRARWRARAAVIASDDFALYRIYAVLCLAKGASVTAEDVHDAWAAWTAGVWPEHPSLVPFDQLTPEVQALEEPYVQAIRQVAAELGGDSHGGQRKGAA